MVIPIPLKRMKITKQSMEIPLGLVSQFAKLDIFPRGPKMQGKSEFDSRPIHIDIHV